MAEDPPENRAAQMVLSPVGGFVIGFLFAPTGGCAVESNILEGGCPAGEQTNFIGLTMGGLVGQVDQAGAFIIGVVAAVLIWAAIGLARS